RHFGKGETPGIFSAQIDLLQILIEASFGKQSARGDLARASQLQSLKTSRGRIAIAQEVTSAQALAFAQELPGLFGQIGERTRLAFHHVLIKLRGTPDGLARVVNDEIQAIAGIEQMPAK